MKKIFKSTSIILLASIPLLSLAQDNTEQSFLTAKNEDQQKALAVSANPENIKIFKDLLNYGADKLQSRLENILKDKENYPKVSNEIGSFKLDIRSNLSKFRSIEGKLSRSKQLNVKNVLNKGLFKTLDQKIAKLESADLKITQKISLLIASNVDASSTANLLLNAEQKLAIAKSSVSEVRSQINNAIASSDGISKEAIRTSVTDANQKILDAVTAYKITLDSIPKLPEITAPTDSPINDSATTSSQIEATSSIQIDNAETVSSSTVNQNQEDISSTSTEATSSEPKN
ncbi:MAG: hypothetical protein WCV55_00880 [Candidatus Paceibacterota bacterium]